MRLLFKHNLGIHCKRAFITIGIIVLAGFWTPPADAENICRVAESYEHNCGCRCDPRKSVTCYKWRDNNNEICRETCEACLCPTCPASFDTDDSKQPTQTKLVEDDATIEHIKTYVCQSSVLPVVDSADKLNVGECLAYAGPIDTKRAVFHVVEMLVKLRGRLYKVLIDQRWRRESDGGGQVNNKDFPVFYWPIFIANNRGGTGMLPFLLEYAEKTKTPVRVVYDLDQLTKDVATGTTLTRAFIAEIRAFGYTVKRQDCRAPKPGEWGVCKPYDEHK